MNNRAVLSAVLSCASAVILAVPVCAEPQDIQTQPAINVVFLDDRATGLPNDNEIRLNDWSSWERRLPTFLDLLSLTGRFRRSPTDGIQESATVFGIELTESLSPESRNARLVQALQQIHAKTKRPSAILARSTKGSDQLRFVVQDSVDYPPESAVTFLKVLADISPVVAPELLGLSFGPFTPPPTLIFDPLFPPPTFQYDDSSRAVGRWALLEETYLLPHYVLHSLSTLNSLARENGLTYYPNSVPEPGTVIVVVAPSDLEIKAPAFVQNAVLGGGVGEVIRGTDFVRGDRKASPGSMIYCPTPAVLSASDLPRINVFSQTIAALERDNQRYLVVAFNDSGQATAVPAMREFSTSRNRDLRLVEPTTGLLGANGTDFRSRFSDLSTLRDLNTKVIVTRTVHNGETIDHFKKVGVPLIEAQGDRVASGLSGGVGPVSLGLTIPTIPTLLQDSDRPRSFRAYLGGTELTGVSRPDTILDICSRPPSSRPSQGGVVFDKGNTYLLDVSGDLRILVEKARRAVEDSGGISGVFKSGGKTTLAVGIPAGPTKRRGQRLDAPVGRFLALDYRANTKTWLPFALPRFFAIDQGLPNFGNAWTFEALAGRGMSGSRRGKTDRLREVTIQVFETGSTLRYCRADAGELPTEKAAKYLPQGGPFVPDLQSNDDGSYSLRLRHGVDIILDSDGLIRTLTSPHADRVDYIRSRGSSLQGQAMANLVLSIESPGQSPQRVMVKGAEQVRYDYLDGRLSAVLAGGKKTSLLYASEDTISSVAVEGHAVKMQYMRDAKSWKLSDAGEETEITYRPVDNTFAISNPPGAPIVWRQGPRNRVIGVMMQGQAVLWTWTSEGRILQMAIGTLDREGGGQKFVPSIVAGASL